MIRSRTIFVIGAGASAEVGLPVGGELKRRIADKLRMMPGQAIARIADDVIHSALLHHVNQAGQRGGRDSLSDYLAAATQMSGAMPLSLSIDNYMEAHQGDERVQVCGKLAIVSAIMDEERKSRLYGEPNVSPLTPRFSGLEQTWFARFFQMVSEACPRSKMTTLFDNVSMINFNYDRCVEHFLVAAIQQYYGLSENAPDVIVKRMLQLHPYGTVGPWHEGSGHWRFGATSGDPTELLDLSRRIRTFTEQSEAPDGLAALQGAISEAEVIVFLGFAFHPINMRLIQPPDGRSKAKRIYGTVHGMSHSDIAVIRDQITKLLPGAFTGADHATVTLVPSTCGDFFSDYSRELAQR